MISEPLWISETFALAVHDRQLAEHGGSEGVRDAGMLASALARPQQLFSYGGPDVDIPGLAASYAFGIARNHPFVDGNKRTAYVVCRAFLVLNDWDFADTMSDRYPVFLGLAAGEIEEDELAAWLRERVRPLGVNER